jgi:hypothetical protein
MSKPAVVFDTDAHFSNGLIGSGASYPLLSKNAANLFSNLTN